VPLVFQLLKEHAIYEKDLDNFEATEEKLAETMTFGPPESNPATSTRPARVVLIYNDSGEPAGFLLYYHNYSSWRARSGIYMEDLFIREPDRNKGYGTKLMRAVAREVLRSDGVRLDWSAVTWNEKSIGFYKSLGAKTLESLRVMRVERESLEKLAD
jgi:GNAT superfamily N-acetyltransferase